MDLQHDVQQEAAPPPDAAPASGATATPASEVESGPEGARDSGERTAAGGAPPSGETSAEAPQQSDDVPTADAALDTGAALASEAVVPSDQAGPALDAYDRDTLRHFYYQMVLIRDFEQKAAEMYTKARIGGYCHLNLGEEASVVGFCAGLDAGDYVYTNYREHGYAIGRGVTSNAVMAELFGKQTGCSKGRGGSMHLFDVGRRFMGGYAIVGGQVPLATGAAFAVAYRGGSEVVGCQMGDGTTNVGAFHESLNMAKIYHLPIVYFVVNNLYGMGLRVDKGSAQSELYRKACAYQMRSARVDGNDVLAVEQAVREAARVAREEHEPSLVEALSFRFRGHSVVDPDRYRDRAEVEGGRAQDPIAHFAQRLIAAGSAREEELRELAAQAKREVDAAVQFAEESPDPPLDSLYEFMYAPASEPIGGGQ